MRRVPILGALLGFSALLIACTAHRGVERRATAAWKWPPDEPRIELEEVIANRPGGGFWRRVTGEKAPGLFQRPYGVAWDGEAIVVTDPGAGRVVRLDSRGRVRATAGDLVAGPIGVASCGAGIVVTDAQRGRLLLLDGELNLVRRLAEGLSRPTGVVCAGDWVLVAETGRHRIVRLPLGVSASVDGSDGIGRRGGGRGEFNFPTALALEGESLWVGDTLNFRVQRLNPAGEYQSSFGGLGDAPGEMPRIKGLAVDREGQLWISDGQTDRVALYRRDGTFLMSLGATGSGDGEFSFPAGVAAHADGRVAIVDSLNRRIAVYRVLASEQAGVLR